MVGAVFSPCCLTWDYSMMEVMKIMATSFKSFHACTITLSDPNPAAGHHWPTPLLETPGYSRASLGQSLWGHCSFLLGPGAHKVLFVPAKSLFPTCVNSGGSVVGLMATSSKRAYAIPRSTAHRAPAPAAVHCWPVPPQETVKHSSVSVSVGFLGPRRHKVCLGPLILTKKYISIVPVKSHNFNFIFDSNSL